MNTSFYLKPTTGTAVQSTVKLISDTSPALIGTVVDENNKPIGGALVTIFVSGIDTATEKPISYTYSDEFGTFTIGPLEVGTLYFVRVSKMTQNLRVLE